MKVTFEGVTHEDVFEQILSYVNSFIQDTQVVAAPEVEDTAPPAPSGAGSSAPAVSDEKPAKGRRGRPKGSTKAKGEGGWPDGDQAAPAAAEAGSAPAARAAPSPAASAAIQAVKEMKDDIPAPSKVPMIGDLEVAVQKFHARFGLDATRALINSVGEAEKYAQIAPEKRAEFIKEVYRRLEQ